MIVEKVYSTIDTHVAGELYRMVILSGIVTQGGGIEEVSKKIKVENKREQQLLLNEPRGHRDVCGCYVVPSAVADFGIILFHHGEEEGLHFLYGGVVASITTLLETGNLQRNKENHYKVETIDGVLNVYASYENGEVKNVSVFMEADIDMEEKETYSIVSIKQELPCVLFPLPTTIPKLTYDYLLEIEAWGRKQTKFFLKERTPFSQLVLFDQQSTGKFRSVTFEKDGTILRSPGFLTSTALAAYSMERGDAYKKITNESIFESSFTVKESPSHPQMLEVQTEAFITGFYKFVFDEEDPLYEGFLLK